MHIRWLKIFCDVVDQGSFSHAAEANGVSQSNASQVVHQLEERLGVQLIDRSKRPFVLTPEGHRFHEGARVIVQRFEDLEREVRSLHEAVRRAADCGVDLFGRAGAHEPLPPRVPGRDTRRPTSGLSTCTRIACTKRSTAGRPTWG